MTTLELWISGEKTLKANASSKTGAIENRRESPNGFGVERFSGFCPSRINQTTIYGPNQKVIETMSWRGEQTGNSNSACPKYSD
jgi:hypothetical protein